MKKIAALTVMALLVFHFSFTFNRPTAIMPQTSFKAPSITVKSGPLFSANLPTASTFRPSAHVHGTFFTFFR